MSGIASELQALVGYIYTNTVNFALMWYPRIMVTGVTVMKGAELKVYNYVFCVCVQ